MSGTCRRLITVLAVGGGGEDGAGGSDEDGVVLVSARQNTDGHVHTEQQPRLRQGR